MKAFIIWNAIVFTFTSYSYYSASTAKNIEYAEGVNISLKQDSRTGRRPIYFFGSLRPRSPSGGGFSFGK